MKNKIPGFKLFNSKEESHLFSLCLCFKNYYQTSMQTTKNKKLYGVAN